VDWLKAILTTDTAQWYETLPFIVGGLFVIIEFDRWFSDDHAQGA
jgi:hypothetical protein